jgi:hypothetical protein
MIKWFLSFYLVFIAKMYWDLKIIFYSSCLEKL